MTDAVIIGAAITILCIATVYSDLLTHRLHRLFRQDYNEHCRICNPPKEDEHEV